MPADTDALNYPYIRVRSADWLKRTLLIFPHVVRMTPHDNAPADDPDIQPFVWKEGRRGALLRPAKLWAPHVRAAQLDLIVALDELLARKGRRFRENLQKHRVKTSEGQTAHNPTVWEYRLGNGHPSFQIHGEKVLHELVDYLMERGLAWRPDHAYWHGPDYLEMHPKLGEAIMATLAMACAENEGFQVVTEFPKLHGKLLGAPRDAILEAAFDVRKPDGSTSGQQIAEFLVYRRCNVEHLTADRIAALKSERDALADFRAKLEDLAKTLPATIHDEDTLEERLNDTLNAMFHDWRQDQANLSTYARKLFGQDALSEPGKLVQKLVEDAAKPSGSHAAAGAAGAAGLAGGHIGGLTLGLASGAAAGFAVAVVFRAIGAWGQTKAVAKASPYRYLTALQDQGVSFSLVQ